MKGLLSQIRNIGIVGVSGICLLATVVGCSSRLQTTVMSGTYPSEPPAVVKAEPLATPVAKADVPPSKIQEPMGIPPLDIPVEEPARPTVHPASPMEIFATSRSEVVEPQISPIPAPPVIAEAKPIPSVAPEPSQALGIPPVVVEPELPTLPTIREQVVPPQELVMSIEPERVEKVAPPQELIAKIAPEPVEEARPVPMPEMPKGEKPEPTPQPMEVAKVVPPSPEVVDTVLKPLRDVYFDYDRFTIRPDAITILKDNSQSLVAGLTDKHIVIEGHCDERGTSSYNMVLGERRAQAVKEFLADLGVPVERLQTVSYGKERPVCTEPTEECWQENRRGHFVLK